MRGRISQWLIAFTMVTATIGIGYWIAADNPAHERLAARIDASFSPASYVMPFWPPEDGDPGPDFARQHGMERASDPICDESGDCPWRDANGILHRFEVNRRQADSIKSLHSIDNREGRPISALGIGLARSKDDVLAAIRAFAPGLSFRCVSTERPAITDCDARFAENYLSIEFDAGQRLTYIYWARTQTHWTELPILPVILLFGLMFVLLIVQTVASSPYATPLSPWTAETIETTQKLAGLGWGAYTAVEAVTSASRLFLACMAVAFFAWLLFRKPRQADEKAEDPA